LETTLASVSALLEHLGLIACGLVLEGTTNRRMVWVLPDTATRFTLDFAHRRNRHLKFDWNSFPFHDILLIIHILLGLRRVFCQNMLELIKAKSDEKNCPARKSRKREDNDDFIKEIAPYRTPKRSSKKRQSQPILNSIRLSGEKDFLFSFTTNTTEPTPLVREDVVSS